MVHLKSGNLDVIKGQNLIEAWEKVLVTSGYTNDAQNRGKPGPKTCYCTGQPKILDAENIRKMGNIGK